jgi:hypothetical protein
MAGKKISQLSSGSLLSLPLSGLTAVVHSGITYQHSLSNLRQILVDSGSHVFTGSQVINGSLTVSGSLTAHQYILSSSITNIVVQNVSGSSVFGNDSSDTHEFTGSLSVTGSLDASQIIAKNFLFVSGFAVVGDPIHHFGDNPEALHVGTTDSYNIAHFKGDNDYYSQVYIKNYNSGSNASTDLVVVADNGTENVHYVDLGINSSTYTGGLVGYANDSYLLNVGKDMYIGTVGGTNHPAKLYLFAENSWETPQITIHTGSQVTFNTSSFTNGFTYEFSGSVKLNNGLTVLGSVTSDGYTGSLDWSNIINKPLLVSGSSQIQYSELTGIPSGLVSGSSQILYTGITNVPNGLISGSSQISDLGYAITGSNTFVGQQIVSGSIYMGTGSIVLSNGTEIYDIGTPGSTSGIGLGNNGFTIDFGSNANDWAIFGNANIIQMAPTNTFTILITSAGEYAWTFNGSGMQFPDGTTQTTAFTGFTEGFVSSSSQISDLGYAITGSNTFIGDQTINGSLIIEGVSEVITVDGGFNGNRTFDYTSGSIFYLTGVTGNGIWNVQNVPTTNNKAIALTYVIEQGVTPYSGSQYQINDSNVTVKWVDNTIPTGSANNTEIIGLTAFRVGSSWNVIGSLSTFGV